MIPPGLTNAPLPTECLRSRAGAWLGELRGVANLATRLAAPGRMWEAWRKTACVLCAALLLFWQRARAGFYSPVFALCSQ
jgi:hypothetical protein